MAMHFNHSKTKKPPGEEVFLEVSTRFELVWKLLQSSA